MRILIVDSDAEYARKLQQIACSAFPNAVIDVEKDEEGLQTMRIVGNNMAWLLKCIELGKQAGITPQREKKLRTNFIR